MSVRNNWSVIITVINSLNVTYYRCCKYYDSGLIINIIKLDHFIEWFLTSGAKDFQQVEVCHVHFLGAVVR